MVDTKLRKSLSRDIRRLITGRMTNDAFDEVFHESYASSNDLAVREIASFCYSLYSSDVLLPYRLRGRHAVDSETRSTAARSMLFLRSDREYEWPPMPDCPGLRLFAGIATYFGIPAGIVLSLLWIAIGLQDPHSGVPFLLATLGLLLLIGSATLALCWPRFLAGDWRSFEEFGDFDVWPFIRRNEFDDARQTCHLLGKSK